MDHVSNVGVAIKPIATSVACKIWSNRADMNLGYIGYRPGHHTSPPLSTQKRNDLVPARTEASLKRGLHSANKNKFGLSPHFL